MKFRDFLLKRLLASTDYLVGYDEDGNYIRISKADLASSIVSNMTIPTLQAQYSANGESWHDRYTSGDIYHRIKVGSGAWSSAIRISVSAYDIWREQGNIGDESDFIESLRGEPGEVDFSSLQLSNITGYTELLTYVNAALQNARNAIIADVTTASVNAVMAQFKEMQLSDITEVKNITDDDFITIVTADGLRKVRMSTLIDNTAIRISNTDSIAVSVQSQLVIMEVSGEQDGSNLNYKVEKAYILGTSHLFMNGQRLVLGVDYVEEKYGFTMMTHTPVQNDSLVFIAAVK